MSRYIDADALMDALNVFKDRKNGNEHFMYGIETAKELLGIQPTVDAVPVVRCENCRHGTTAHGISDGWVLCTKPYVIGAVMHPNDWFCADGKRKDGEHDN